MPAIAPTGYGWGDANMLINTGKGLELVMPVPNTFKTSMRGETYTMVRCSFHRQSEHTTSGLQHPLEAQCLHTKDQSSVGRTHGMLSIFWELAPSSSPGSADPFLEQFLSSAPGVGEADASVTVAMYPLLAGLQVNNYWQYDGSLTTPPCTEVVDWHVLMTPRSLSQHQLDTVMEKTGSIDNFRMPQGLHGRQVRGCDNDNGQSDDDDVQSEYSWGYPEDSEWRGACISGVEQSPVDLAPCNEAGAVQRGSSAISPLDWGVAHEIRNTGFGLQIVMPEPHVFKTRMRGELYTMLQCHFHWGSEHTVGGVQKELEGNCVHTKDGMTTGRSHGVLGVFWDLGSEADPDPWLSQWIDLAPGVGEADACCHRIDMQPLTEGIDLSEYWQYDGSLTSPPCSEVYDWQLLMEARIISPSQLDIIRTKTGSWGQSHGNFRTPKPLGARTVYGCQDPQVGGSESQSGQSRALRPCVGGSIVIMTTLSFFRLLLQ